MALEWKKIPTVPVPVADGGTGQVTAQAAIDTLTAVTGATNEHVLTKDTATGNAIFKAAVGGGGDDVKVAIDAGATAGYLGAASNDGVLRTGSGLTYTDGGDYITIDTVAKQIPSGGLYLDAAVNNHANDSVFLIPLDTKKSGFTDGIESTGDHRITPGVAGYYSIHGCICWSSSFINNSYYQARVYISTNLVAINTSNPNAGGDTFVHISLNPVYLSASDYIELFGWKHGDTTAADVASGSYSTFLSVQRVR
jgi:hypothetical protein